MVQEETVALLVLKGKKENPELLDPLVLEDL